jgi:hypothetical protein
MIGALFSTSLIAILLWVVMKGGAPYSASRFFKCDEDPRRELTAPIIAACFILANYLYQVWP